MNKKIKSFLRSKLLFKFKVFNKPTKFLKTSLYKTMQQGITRSLINHDY